MAHTMYAWIFPSPASLALKPSGPPPKFEVVTDHPLFFIVEVATWKSLFDITNQALRVTKGPNLNFFNSFWGLPSAGIPGQQLRTPPSNRTDYSLPVAVWTAFASSERIYYRVIAFYLFDRGQPTGKLFYSTEDRDYKRAPYIHVLQSGITGFYTCSKPPSAHRSPDWLMVEGNKLVKGRRSLRGSAAARPAPAPAEGIVLRGINLSGLQYRQHDYGTPEARPRKTQRWLEAAGFTQACIQEIASWKANIIRLPINQDWVLNGVAGKDGREYLKDIDQIVEWAASAGMYVLLDLQVLDTQPISSRPPGWTQPMPDNLSLLFWRILASRYQSEPAVLYDLCNEPHKPTKNDQKGTSEWKTYYGYVPPEDKGWLQLWHEWARQIEGVIHDVHEDAVIFVSGIGGPCFASSLHSMPVPMPPFYVNPQKYIPNTVYSCHIYYQQKDDGDGVDDSKGLEMGTSKADQWTYWFGFEKLRQSYPIFIGEFGAKPQDFDANFSSTNPVPQAITDMLKWGQDLTDYLSELRKVQNGKWPGLAGWTAWSWGDEPHLVQRGASTTGGPDRPYQMDPANPALHALTEFGKLVKTELGKP